MFPTLEAAEEFVAAYAAQGGWRTRRSAKNKGRALQIVCNCAGLPAPKEEGKKHRATAPSLRCGCNWTVRLTVGASDATITKAHLEHSGHVPTPPLLPAAPAEPDTSPYRAIEKEELVADGIIATIKHAAAAPHLRGITLRTYLRAAHFPDRSPDVAFKQQAINFIDNVLNAEKTKLFSRRRDAHEFQAMLHEMRGAGGYCNIELTEDGRLKRACWCSAEQRTIAAMFGDVVLQVGHMTWA